MNKTQAYIIASVACIGIFILYFIIGISLRWKHGGGIFAMIILMGALSATWKGITSLSKQEKDEDEDKKIEENNETK